MKIKSYGIKSSNGVVASATFAGKRKPSKKVIKSLHALADLAYAELSKKSNNENSCILVKP